MKQNSNTAAVKNLKEMLAADYYNEIDLVKEGVQVYAYNLTGDEYNVIVKAERTKGRYYFTTREGYRLTWSSFTAEQLGIICRDFADQVKRETITTDTDHETTETVANMTAADIYEEMRTFAQHYATAYNCNLIASDALHDRQRFAYWQNIANDTTETTNPRRPFFFAIRKQGAESGTREHVAERCKVLGRPVYIMKVERATNANGETLAGRYTVTKQFTKENDPSTTEAEREAENHTTLQKPAEIKADELDNETDPARVPDWTRHAYEVAEMKRTGCTFGEARRRVQEVRARIMARKADLERENVGRIERKAANGHELTNDEREAVKSYHKKHGGRIPEAVAACALFLLSLNFGTGKPATMYTDKPEEVAETIKANAPEVVAEWHQVPTPDGLPPYDVPALML